MSWYWLDHTLIQKRVIYLFLSKQLPLIDDVIGLIVLKIKPFLTPWCVIVDSQMIEYNYQRYLHPSHIYQGMYEINDISQDCYFHIDYDLLQASNRNVGTYQLMRQNGCVLKN